MPVPFFAAVLLAAVAALYPAVAGAETPPPNGCVSCHQALPDARLSGPAKALAGHDVHAARGFSCVDCHGGDATARDRVAAKAVSTGFRGAPRGQAQIQACARCHSDAAVMRRFAPRQRIDQAAEYASSGHGRRLATGDARVATCVSCHGAHGVRAVSDPASPVHAPNVAATCAACHADPAHMRRPDGTGISTSQRADYEKSVHFFALTKNRDLSAPTCNDCHGNHGAMPPGVNAVSNVCGTCHAVFAASFSKSGHQAIFEKGCVECHGNHAIVKPTDALLLGGPGSPCASCHEGNDDPGVVGGKKMHAGIAGLAAAMGRTHAMVERLKSAGMEMGDQELALAEVQNQLIKARADVHTFAPAVVEAVTGEGVKQLGAIEQAGARAMEELRYRRIGLGAMLGVVLLVLAALVLKIRQIDRRHQA